MSLFFQLIDVTTGNLVTEFQSEAEAIEALSGVQVEEGDQPILDFALFRFHDGHPSLVAKQDELIRYIAHAGRRFVDQDAHEEPRSPSKNTKSSSIPAATNF